MSAPHQPVDHLKTAFQTLRARWRDVQPFWRDKKGHEFERNYWEPLAQDAQATLEEMQRLAEVLAKAWKNAP